MYCIRKSLLSSSYLTSAILENQNLLNLHNPLNKRFLHEKIDSVNKKYLAP